MVFCGQVNRKNVGKKGVKNSKQEYLAAMKWFPNATDVFLHRRMFPNEKQEERLGLDLCYVCFYLKTLFCCCFQVYIASKLEKC